MRAGRARERGAGGDAGLRAEDGERERSGTRGVVDTRGLRAAAEGSQGDRVGGTQEIVREERRRSRMDTNMIRKTGKRKEM